MDEDDFEKKVRAFGGKYIAPGIKQAAENSENLQIAIFALLETISWIVQQENPDNPIEDFEDYVSRFLEDWRSSKTS